MKLTIFILFFAFPFYSWSGNLVDVYNNLDITSFNSSLGPMKADDETRFPDFKQLPKPIINDSEIIIEDEYWLYSIKLVKEKNQDLYICFLDKSKESSYYTQAPMIIRKYGNDYVAIKAVANVCEDFAK